jgi:xylan 1,4-beta-xylosidase
VVASIVVGAAVLVPGPYASGQPARDTTDLQRRALDKGVKGAEGRRTWVADNGNGTFTNPLFYDEFPDPDVIRVGDDYYMTGTTMHAMPGLPVLHSRDLVNWDFLGYAAERLDFGPAYRLEDGKEIYGQGIWAPCLRFHNGRYFIFSNVNGQTTQVFTSVHPAGPWTRTAMRVSLHDPSVLFDDDGTAYIVWGYDEIRMAELNADCTDLLPGTEKVIIPKGCGAGEGSHFYKIDGKYFITMAQWDPVCYQVCARADKPSGPYTIAVMSAGESFGTSTGWRVSNASPPGRIQLISPREKYAGCVTLHQGGIVQTNTGEWWGLSMMDHNSVGRLTCLSPVTWVEGRPYMGLPGNLTRTPLTWTKPRTGYASEPRAPYERCDDFSGATLKPIWQWNHVPVEKNWSLTERKGSLCLRSLPAGDFWRARNSLTQRAPGPVSIATTLMDGTGLAAGDIAGLALLSCPYGWIGLARDHGGLQIRQFDQRTNRRRSTTAHTPRVWLRVHCDFDAEEAQFSYSSDGKTFQCLGERMIMAFQLKTFQGVRFALFNYNTTGVEGGTAAFNEFDVDEPRPCGLTQPIPCGEAITLTSRADSTVLVNWKHALRAVPAGSPLAGGASYFRVLDRGKGRIALQSAVDGSYVKVTGAGSMGEVRLEADDGGESSAFQWTDMQRGDLMLMSVATHRYLTVHPQAGDLCSADSPGAGPDRKDGSCFAWAISERKSGE